MEIVDAQIHIWSQGLPSNPSHWQITSFSAAEAIKLMDEAQVDAAIIHPPGWDPNSTEVAIEAVERWPGRFAIMGSIPLDQPAPRAVFASWRKTPGMLGMRFMFLKPELRDALAAGAYDWLFSAAEAEGVPIAALATDSLGALGRIAERHPGLKLTIDHMGGRGGNTTLKDHAAMTHVPELVALAKHPNVGVKVTGAPGYSSEAYPYPILSDTVHRIFDAFGPARTFWGTDISKMPCTWRQCVTMFTEEMPWLEGEDQRLVMGQAIRDWWGWPRRA